MAVKVLVQKVSSEGGAKRVKNSSNRVMRLVTATAVAGVVSIASVSGASAASDPDAESYPITTDPVTHPPREAKPLPATGS